MVGGNEHNDIESGTGGFGYDNMAEIPRKRQGTRGEHQEGNMT